MILRLGFCLVVLALSVTVAQATSPVTFDAACNNGGTGTGNKNCDVAASASVTCVVMMAEWAAGTDDIVSGFPTYAGSAMTLQQKDLAWTSGKSHGTWYVIAPPTGTQTANIKTTSGVNIQQVTLSFTGTCERLANFGSASGSSSPATHAVTVSDASNGLAVQALAFTDNPSLTAGTGETIRKSGTNASNSQHGLTSDTNGSHTFGPTFSGSHAWHSHGFSLEPNAAVTPSALLPLLGVGN